MSGSSNNTAAECPFWFCPKRYIIRIVEHHGAANMLGSLLEIGAINVVGPDELRNTPKGRL
jgi:hypothetical protein